MGESNKVVEGVRKGGKGESVFPTVVLSNGLVGGMAVAKGKRPAKTREE